MNFPPNPNDCRQWLYASASAKAELATMLHKFLPHRPFSDMENAANGLLAHGRMGTFNKYVGSHTYSANHIAICEMVKKFLEDKKELLYPNFCKEIESQGTQAKEVPKKDPKEEEDYEDSLVLVLPNGAMQYDTDFHNMRKMVALYEQLSDPAQKLFRQSIYKKTDFVKTPSPTPKTQSPKTSRSSSSSIKKEKIQAPLPSRDPRITELNKKINDAYKEMAKAIRDRKVEKLPESDPLYIKWSSFRKQKNELSKAKDLNIEK